MQELPHLYRVTAEGAIEGGVELRADRLPVLSTAPPAEFGGPGDRWSPETLLVGAVADCFILTFRAVARASRLPWTSLQCRVAGTLDRVERVTQFTRVDIHARLSVPAHADPELARRSLEKAESGCLISNSLKADVHLDPEIDVVSCDFEPLMAVAS